MTDELKKSLSLVANKWYRSELGQPEDTVLPAHSFFLSNEQETRLRDAEKMYESIDLQEHIDDARSNVDNETPTLNKIITRSVKSALIEMIIQSGEEGRYVSSRGNPMDILFTGNPVVNNENVKLMMRMLTILPRWDSLERVEENLLVYCRLLAAGEKTPNMRNVQVLYCRKLLESLDYLRRGKPIDQFTILSLFGRINMKHEMRYCMGSKGILNQMTHWVKTNKKRTEPRCESQPSNIGAQEWFETYGNTSKTRTVKRRKLCDENKVSHADLPSSDNVDETLSLYSGRTDEICNFHHEGAKRNMHNTKSSKVPDQSEVLATTDMLSENLEYEENSEHELFSSGSIDNDCNLPSDKLVSEMVNVDSQYDIINQNVKEKEKIFIANMPKHKVCVIVTPTKGRPRTDFTDNLKYKLLETYLLDATDPMISGAKVGHLRLLREQCYLIRDSIVNAEGVDTVWKLLFSPHTLADKMYRQGFRKQGYLDKGQGDVTTGLFQIMRKVVGDSASTAEVREKSGLILTEA